MALTIPQLQTLIDTNLADNSNIIPAEHREVEHEIVNYLATVGGGSGSAPGSIPNSTMYTVIKYITSWQQDRQYTVNTDIASGTIIQVHVDLECTSSNNGFSVGDIVDTPRAYPTDSGRTAGQGMGVQYRANVPGVVHLSTNDGVWIMSAWQGDGNIGDTFNVGAASGSWKIRVLITYIN